MREFLLKIVVVFMLLLGVLNAFSQTPVKPVPTVDDYKKWSTLWQEKIAPDGKWITYSLKYDTGKDTLFVKHIDSTLQYIFPQAKNAIFSFDSKWLTVHHQDGIVLLNLNTGIQKSIVAASKADFNKESKFLVSFISDAGSQQLQILELESGSKQKIQDVKEYILSPDRQSIAFITQDNSIQILELGKLHPPKTLMKPTPDIRKHLIWNDTGSAVAFLEEVTIGALNEGNHKIYLIEDVDKNKKIHSLDPTFLEGSASIKKILYNPTFTPLLVASKPTRVLFFTQGKNHKDDTNVEVWNSVDKLEFKRNLMAGNPESRPKLAIWWPETNRIDAITTNQYPSVYLTPDRNKALVYDPHQYEPQKDIVGPADLWLTHLNTGNGKLILEKQSGYVGSMGVSPNSRYLNYYRNKHWWVYDMDTDKHTKITNTLGSFEDITYNKGGTPPSYGFAGWSADSQFLIVYSQYDVWLIAADGKSKKRITNGEASGKQFRVCSNLTPNLQTFNFYDFTSVHFDLNKGIVLEAFDVQTKAGGYYKWTTNGGLVQMIFKNAQLSRIKKAEQSDSYILIEQKAEVSPQILLLEGSNKAKVLVKTNKHQENFAWTKATLVSYTNSDGKPLQGVLNYPAGYQPHIKYPLIVHVYEDQSRVLHNYYNPSLFKAAGFSPANYTTDGYFVLYPSIVYNLGNPGQSAVDCVEAAVKKVLEKGIIDENRIGLIGHSFGGYEASFIVTQSNMFAAAVAGAACTDLVAHSLTLEVGTGRSQMWRYQTYQMRMGSSLYENFEGFVKNSPITYANNIAIPLLSWTGKNDNQVDPQQSIALHMAMRSLKKPHTLLLYPNEGHILMNQDSQKDLTLKVKAWFDLYLKDKPFPNNVYSE